MLYSNYANFLRESKSISDSCILFQRKISPEIIDFIKSNKDDNVYESFYFDFISDDFKVKNLKLTIDIINTFEVNNTCNATANFQQSLLIDTILENGEITFKINIIELDEDFIYHIESVILHELLHLFQFYNITLKKKFRPTSWSIGVVLSQLKKKNIIKEKYIKQICDNLYISLNHEIAAQLHQYYYFRKI